MYKKGSKVRIVNSLHRDVEDGEIGTIIQVDKNDKKLPYLVSFPIFSNWFPDKCLRPVEAQSERFSNTVAVFTQTERIKALEATVRTLNADKEELYKKLNKLAFNDDRSEISRLKVELGKITAALNHFHLTDADMYAKDMRLLKLLQEAVDELGGRK